MLWKEFVKGKKIKIKIFWKDYLDFKINLSKNKAIIVTFLIKFQ